MISGLKNISDLNLKHSWTNIHIIINLNKITPTLTFTMTFRIKNIDNFTIKISLCINNFEN